MRPSSSGKSEPAASADEQNAPPVRVISQPSLATFIQGAAFGFLACLLLTGLFTLLTRRSDPPPIVLQPPPTPLPSPTALPTATPVSLVVFVSGAVAAPGLYTLPPGARVGDALSAAGGLTAAAAAAAVNQAEPLWDGAQIHVPLQTAPAAVEPVAGVSGAALAPAAPAAPGAAPAAGHLVNINTASPEELATLPGIGPAKAAAIVEGRPFATVDDLERVSGIGPKTMEQVRNLVTVN